MRKRLCEVDSGSYVRLYGVDFLVVRGDIGFSLRRVIKFRLCSNSREDLMYGLRCQMWVDVLDPPVKKNTSKECKIEKIVDYLTNRKRTMREIGDRFRILNKTVYHYLSKIKETHDLLVSDNGKGQKVYSIIEKDKIKTTEYTNISGMEYVLNKYSK